MKYLGMSRASYQTTGSLKLSIVGVLYHGNRPVLQIRAVQRVTACFLGDWREMYSSGRLPVGVWSDLMLLQRILSTHQYCIHSTDTYPVLTLCQLLCCPLSWHKFSKKTHMVFAHMGFKSYIYIFS